MVLVDMDLNEPIITGNDFGGGEIFDIFGYSPVYMDVPLARVLTDGLTGGLTGG